MSSFENTWGLEKENDISQLKSFPDNLKASMTALKNLLIFVVTWSMLPETKCKIVCC